MAKLAETALIMNTIDFSFQNNQNKTFENPTIPRYSLKTQPEELGLSLIILLGLHQTGIENAY